MSRRSGRAGGAILLTLILALASAAAAPCQAATLITFDSYPDGSDLPPQPGLFIQTTALRDLYAPLGVHFRGPGPLDGGAILDGKSGFGVYPISGSNFLAFNTNAVLADGGVPRGPETVLFDEAQFHVSFMLAGSIFYTTFDVSVYDENDNLLATTFLSVLNWTRVEFKAIGIRRLEIIHRAGSNAFVIDDLYFDATVIPGGAVPEPASMVLAGTGAAALALYALRRRRKAPMQ